MEGYLWHHLLPVGDEVLICIHADREPVGVMTAEQARTAGRALIAVADSITAPASLHAWPAPDPSTLQTAPGGAL